MNKHKKILFLLAVTMCLSFVSCTKDNSSLSKNAAKTPISSSNTINNSYAASTTKSYDSQAIKPPTTMQLSKKAEELKGLTPEQVIRKYFEYYNKKDKDGVMSTLTVWHDTPNTAFGFERNFQWIKIINIKPAEDLQADNYMSYGRGKVNGVKRENVKVYRVDFETKYSKDTPPFPNGKAWDYFFLIKVSDDSPWLIDDIGV